MQPLRKIIELDGLLLIHIIEKILSNSQFCPQINHIIFIMPLPFQLCYNNEISCAGCRNFRKNAAIASLNQFYIQNLLNITIDISKKLTIIDSYAIIRSIGLWHVNNVCGHHYICKVKIDSESNKNYNPSNYIIGHTPAGDAIISAILTALVL